MMVVGGGALVFVVGWEVRHRNPAEFSKSAYWFVVLAFAALLSLLGSLMTVSFLSTKARVRRVDSCGMVDKPEVWRLLSNGCRLNRSTSGRG